MCEISLDILFSVFNIIIDIVLAVIIYCKCKNRSILDIYYVYLNLKLDTNELLLFVLGTYREEDTVVGFFLSSNKPQGKLTG